MPSLITLADIRAAATRLSVDSLEARTTQPEHQISRLTLLLAIALIMLAALCILSALTLAHLHTNH